MKPSIIKPLISIYHFNLTHYLTCELDLLVDLLTLHGHLVPALLHIAGVQEDVQLLVTLLCLLLLALLLQSYLEGKGININIIKFMRISKIIVLTFLI